MTRGDRRRIREADERVADLRRKAAEAPDGARRAMYERYAQRAERYAAESRRHPLGLGLVMMAVVLVELPWAIAYGLGLGWWGLLPSVALAVYFVRRLLIRRRADASGPHAGAAQGAPQRRA